MLVTSTTTFTGTPGSAPARLPIEAVAPSIVSVSFLFSFPSHVIQPDCGPVYTGRTGVGATAGCEGGACTGSGAGAVSCGGGADCSGAGDCCWTGSGAGSEDVAA